MRFYAILHGKYFIILMILFALCSCGGATRPTRARVMHFGEAQATEAVNVDTTQEQSLFSLVGDDRLRNNPLQAIDQQQEISICIRVFGYQDHEVRSVVKMLRSEAQHALKQWMTALEGASGWSGHDLRFNDSLFDTNGGCGELHEPAPYATIRIFKWKNRDQMRTYFRANQGLFGIQVGEQFRSFALLSTQTVILDEDDQHIQAVMIHEIGHILGLGDSYYGAEVQLEFSYMTPTLMNGGRFSLSPEDRLALHVIWDFVETGNLECPKPYQRVNFTSNVYENVFCVARSKQSVPAVSNDLRVLAQSSE